MIINTNDKISRIQLFMCLEILINILLTHKLKDFFHKFQRETQLCFLIINKDLWSSIIIIIDGSFVKETILIIP